jgi:chitinase
MDYRGALKFMANNPSAKMIWDDTAKADYIYDQPTKTLITLDTPRSVAEKGLYIKEKGLAGIFSWELDGDGNGDILNAMFKPSILISAWVYTHFEVIWV